MEYLYFINNRILSLANNLDVPFNCFCMYDLRINLYSQCYWSILTKLSWSFLLVIYFLSWREYKVLSVSFWSYISCNTCHKQWSCSGLFPELFGDVNSLFSFFFFFLFLSLLWNYFVFWYCFLNCFRYKFVTKWCDNVDGEMRSLPCETAWGLFYFPCWCGYVAESFNFSINCLQQIDNLILSFQMIKCNFFQLILSV